MKYMPRARKRMLDLNKKWFLAGIVVITLAVLYLTNSDSVGSFIEPIPDLGFGVEANYIDLELQFLGAYPNVAGTGQHIDIVVAVKHSVTGDLPEYGPLYEISEPKLSIKDRTSGETIAVTSIDNDFFGGVNLEKTTIYTYKYYASVGVHEIEAFVDYEDTLIELNENNNLKTVTIYKRS
jgi:hypothetical protein